MAWTRRTGIMLCQPLDEHNLERNFKLSRVLMVQPKLDGNRAWVRWEGSTPHLISSQGNEITSCQHINIALREFGEQTNFRQQLDGELYHHNMAFEEICSLVGRSNYAPDCCDVQFHIFDYKSAEPNGERIIKLHDALAKWQASPELSNILVEVSTYPVQTMREIDEYLDRFVRQGYEGIIVRNPLTPYMEKRPFTILKWKPGRKDTYTIFSVNEAISQTGEPKGEVGSLVCIDPEGHRFKVGCGTNITQEKKRHLWDNRDVLIGQHVEVAYQNLTKYGVPRFGKFLEIMFD